MKLIYGSVALKHWFPDFHREPKDIDYITNEPHPKNTKEVEYYWIEEFSYLIENNKDKQFVEPDFLYTIKVSHAAWDINWVKTMKDIEFLKRKGAKLDKVFFNMLYERWKTIHGSKKVKMNTKNEYFFKKNIKRKYDHDWVHEQIAFNDRPMHEKIRKDLNNPYCSEELWNKLSYEDKIKTVLEELYVLALERYIFVDKPLPIPFAINKTLKNMITSTTSGWFNLFIIDNFEKIRTYPTDYLITKLSLIK